MLLARILFHIKETYVGLLDLEAEAEMKPFNEDYKKFVSKKGKIELLKKVNSLLNIGTKRKFLINLLKNHSRSGRGDDESYEIVHCFMKLKSS